VGESKGKIQVTLLEASHLILIVLMECLYQGNGDWKWRNEERGREKESESICMYEGEGFRQRLGPKLESGLEYKLKRVTE